MICLDGGCTVVVGISLSDAPAEPANGVNNQHNNANAKRGFLQQTLRIVLVVSHRKTI